MARTALRLFVAICAIGLVTTVPAQVIRQITDTKLSRISGGSSITGDGSAIYQITSGDTFGSNPGHAPQISEWDASTGTGQELLSVPQGVQHVSVTDDGQKLAVITAADLVGQNHDESVELYVMNSDGTGVVQLTDQAAVGAGTLQYATISGSGNRVLFLASFDPLGTNPGQEDQVFVIDTDGTNLRQLTTISHATFPSGISDDGDRVIFNSRADLTGQNADGLPEIYAVNADGTNLRQLVQNPGLSTSGQIAGNGSKVVFISSEDLTGANPNNDIQLFVVDWDGNNLTQVTAPGSVVQGPSITDDASTVFFYDDRVDATLNPEGNYEIWKISIDGTGETILTQTTADFFNSSPEVSGDGSRVAFHSRGGEFTGGNNPDLEAELISMNSSGGDLRQLTALPDAGVFCEGLDGPVLSDDGSRIAFECGDEIFVANNDGSARTQLTSFADPAVARAPDVTGDGQTVVFDVDTIPGSGQYEVFAVDADGSNLLQLTPAPWFDASGAIHPVVADNGSWVVFQSGDIYFFEVPIPTGSQLWRVALDGTGLMRLTDDSDSLFKWPRIDGDGTWVTFQSQSDELGTNPTERIQVFRIRTDGTGYEQLTFDADHGSTTPDIDGSGNLIAYASWADPLGTNPENNREVFLLDVTTSTLTQLTTTAAGDSSHPRFSRDGGYVFFHSSAPLFEAGSSEVYDGYRYAIATARLDRVTSLRRPPSSLSPGGYRDRGTYMEVDGTGRFAVIGRSGNYTETNADLNREGWVADFEQAPAVTVSREAPTIFSWEPTPQAIRYDAIRGDVANLSIDGSDVDLGSVVCLEDESPDANTEGYGDTEPAVGQVYFYLFRGTQGQNDGPGSYGQSSGGLERVGGGGDCGT